MGMSTHITVFRPPDERFQAMKKVYDACVEADLDVPDDVLSFFGYEKPDMAGLEIDISHHVCCKPWGGTSSSGYEIEVAKLPSEVRIVRFYNEW